MFWASQGPGRQFTVPNFVGVLFNGMGVLFNFGRAPLSWAHWGPFWFSEGSIREAFGIFGAILGASWLAFGVPRARAAFHSPQSRGGPIQLYGGSILILAGPQSFKCVGGFFGCLKAPPWNLSAYSEGFWVHLGFTLGAPRARKAFHHRQFRGGPI